MTAPPSRPRASVIVAARNAERTLAACLDSLARLEYPDYDVIVADDGSTDATAAIASGRAGVRVVAAGGHGPSAARNLAVAAASGGVVAFTDADCTVHPAWLTALVDALQVPGTASAGGRQINAVAGRTAGPEADAPTSREAGSTAGASTEPESRSKADAPSHRDARTEASGLTDRKAGSAACAPTEREGVSAEAEQLDAFFRLASVVSDYTRSAREPREVAHNASCTSAYWRRAFDEVGGFREGLWPGEDVDLDHRLRLGGHRCRYTPDAVVVHHRPARPGWLRSMMWRYGEAQGRLVRLHGPFRALHAMPLVLAAGIAAQVFWLVPPLRPAIAAMDAAAVAAGVVLFARAARPRLWPALAGQLAVAVIAWNAAFVAALLRRRA